VGEIAAAHIAGVLSLSDASKLIAARGALMGALPQGGAMLAVQASEAEAEAAIAGREALLSIAAINSPGSAVLSGEAGAIDELEAELGERGKKTKRLAVSHAFHSHLMEPMLEQFAEVAKSLAYGEPQIPIAANATGELLSAEQATDPAYWVAHVRGAVRFADAVETLREQGATCFLELGPDPVLSAMAAEGIEAAGQEGPQPSFAPTLRGDRGEAETLTGALASAHLGGAKLDWDAFFAGTAAKRVALPTYPFQRERYWLEPSSGSGGLAAAGQAPAGHPLLGAAVALAGGELEGEWLLTGRISLSTHPWLADHAVGGTVLLPGTAFVEMGLVAGGQAGTGTVEEMILQAPLFLPEQGAVQVQVKLAAPDPEGRREIAIHSRPEPGEDEASPQWTLHATGVLSSLPAESPEGAELSGEWPPAGAEPIDAGFLYDRLAEAGFDYGPAFQGLTAAWKLGAEVFAEVSLDPDRAAEAERFAIHPALLDSAGHAVIDVALGAAAAEGGGESGLRLPFAWRGVSVASPGAAALRVRVNLEDNGLLAADEAGAAVLRIDEVLGRAVDPSQLQGAAQRNRSLYRVEWPELTPRPAAGAQPRVAILGDSVAPALDGERYADLAALLEAIEAGAPAPEVVVAAGRAPGEEPQDLPEAFHASAFHTLDLIQRWVACEALGGSFLALLTEGAVVAIEDEDPDLATAPLWGLLRSAQTEYLDRFALIDVDGTEATAQALAGALAVAEEEPQLAIREGRLLTPRLAWMQVDEEATAPPIDPGSTVLITGGTGGLGALMARHLASRHGVRHLLLASRSGEDSEGAAELVAELAELGAEARIAACDVSDRDRLEALIGSIPAERPLGAVLHLAGVLDDGVLEAQDPERFARVFVPKADAAWYLHELTAGLDLSHFVLFSSAAGVIGNPAQANYSAANVFLNALAAHRHADGLPATSLAWGGWAIRMALQNELELIEVERHLRLGYSIMSPERGLELFDLAISLEEPQPVPLELDRDALRTMAAAGLLLPIMRGLVRLPASRGRESGSLARELAAIPAAERESAVLELVRDHTATVLGHATTEEIDPGRAFQELGFDSLAAVELRNRLGAATGLRLPPTLIFDYPSVGALAAYLLTEAAPGEGEEEVDPAEAEFRQALARVPLARLRAAGLIEGLMEVVGVEGAAAPASDGEDSIERIDEMDIEDLVAQTLEREAAGAGDGEE
jgi:polyene macrolide polyketide synthase